MKTFDTCLTFSVNRGRAERFQLAAIEKPPGRSVCYWGLNFARRFWLYFLLPFCVSASPVWRVRALLRKLIGATAEIMFLLKKNNLPILLDNSFSRRDSNAQRDLSTGFYDLVKTTDVLVTPIFHGLNLVQKMIGPMRVVLTNTVWSVL